MTPRTLVEKEIEFLKHWVHSIEPFAGVGGEDLQAAIAKAAYARAERRGFAPGYELADWLAAESELRRHLNRLRAPAD